MGPKCEPVFYNYVSLPSPFQDIGKREESVEDACRYSFAPVWERLGRRAGLVKRLSFALHPDSCHCLHPQIKLKYFFKLATEKTFCMKDKVLLKIHP